MPSSHLILCRPLLLLTPIPPSIRVFSDESTLGMRWPKYWSFSFSIIPSKEIPGLIFRMDWLDLLAVQGTLKSLLLANLHLLSFFVSLAGSVLILPIFSKDQLFASLMFFIVFLISVLLISYPPSPSKVFFFSGFNAAFKNFTLSSINYDVSLTKFLWVYPVWICSGGFNL